MAKTGMWMWAAALTALASVAGRPVAAQPGAEADESFGIKAVTRPSQDATMGFRFPTQVAEVLVRDGQAVEVGQRLVRADDAEAQAAYDVALLRAQSTLDVDLQTAALELARVEYEATKSAFEGGGGSSIELDRSRLQRDTAVIQLDAARQRDVEADRQLEQLAARLDSLRLVAPFSGIIDAVLVDVGDSVRDTDPVVRVVSVDPLLIDAATPTELTLGLSPMDPAWVLVRIGDEPRVLSARIVGISPVADSVTGSRRVRVEATNPAGLPAGLTAFVRFEPPEAAWTPAMTSPAQHEPDDDGDQDGQPGQDDQPGPNGRP
ncbi:MAG: efflux RND transporter periplasmic adaptor subunit [Planctomycetota bacterium]